MLRLGTKPFESRCCLLCLHFSAASGSEGQMEHRGGAVSFLVPSHCWTKFPELSCFGLWPDCPICTSSVLWLKGWASTPSWGGGYWERTDRTKYKWLVVPLNSTHLYGKRKCKATKLVGHKFLSLHFAVTIHNAENIKDSNANNYWDTVYFTSHYDFPQLLSGMFYVVFYNMSLVLLIVFTTACGV